MDITKFVTVFFFFFETTKCVTVGVVNLHNLICLFIHFRTKRFRLTLTGYPLPLFPFSLSLFIPFPLLCLPDQPVSGSHMQVQSSACLSAVAFIFSVPTLIISIDVILAISEISQALYRHLTT